MNETHWTIGQAILLIVGSINAIILIWGLILLWISNASIKKDQNKMKYDENQYDEKLKP